MPIGQPKDRLPRDKTRRDDVAIREIEFHLANLTGALIRHCGKAAPGAAQAVRKAVSEALAEMLKT